MYVCIIYIHTFYTFIIDVITVYLITLFMESQITSLINNLSSIKTSLKQGNNINLLINNSSFLNEFILLINILLEQNSYSSFELCYLHLLLGKNLSITKVVDLLSNNLSSLDNIHEVDKGILNTLTGNIRGRLRKLSSKDSKTDKLISTLNKLNGSLPLDLVNKYINNENNNITFRLYKDEDWEDICFIFAQSNLIELQGCCDLKAAAPLESYKQCNLLKYEFNKVCACHNGKVIGYVAYSIKELSIKGLYILPEYMGKKIGKTLFRIALINLGVNVDLDIRNKYLIEEGVINPLFNSLFIKKRAIHIICMTNNLRAFNLYKSHGFIPKNMYMDILNGYKCMYTNMYKEL